MKYIIGLFCIIHSVCVFSWNALGHRLVAQIAYNHMTAHAKQVFNQYNQSMDKVYKPQTWANAAVWLDTLRYQDVAWFSTMHYVDMPFSDSPRQLPAVQDINALWAMRQSKRLLLNKYATDFDKGTALRVILHIVGDLHQPLHTATRISNEFPQGDRGGNLVPVNTHRIAKNLHTYWDRGGGLLMTKRRYTDIQVTKTTSNIEARWPCHLSMMDINPSHWVLESHALAVNKVYKELPENNVPDKYYQRLTKKITEQQLALAGCRLAAILNQIDDDLVKGHGVRIS